MTSTMNMLPYGGTMPQLAAAPREARAGHALVGRVTLGADAWLGAGSVIRADGHFVRIGEALHFGRGATVHIAHDLYPTVVGDRACVGANAVVHACTLGDDVVVEDGAVILDGATVGAGTVVELGSIVYPRSSLEPGMLYAGRPARPVRPLPREELLARAAAQRARNEADDAGWHCRPGASAAAPDAYVAGTCDLQGTVRLAAGASVWFGCRLDGRAGTIEIGEHCNVQDNSVLVAGAHGLSLGAQTTIGHNVELLDCRVGVRCLVGIGSRIAAGTVIDDDTFVAGGCVTEPGQHLEGGKVWGGSPARPLGPLDDGKRQGILRTAAVYADYARAMRPVDVAGRRTG